MPKGTSEVILSNEDKIVFKACIDSNRKVTIPAQLKNHPLIKQNGELIFTVESP